MLFTESKYSLAYFRIVEHRKANPSTERTESHHIIPRCLGGTDDPDNLVDLTCREHFICHLLLTKMNDHQGLVRAAWLMAHTRGGVKCNSRTYAYLRENLKVTDATRKKMSKAAQARKLSQKHCEDISKRLKGRKLTAEHRANIKKGQAWRKGVPRSEETKQKMREARSKQPPFSEETKRKMSESAKRRPPQSQATKAKRTAAIKKQPKVSCYRCRKVLSGHMLNNHQRGKACSK